MHGKLTAFDYLMSQIEKPDNVPALLLLTLAAFYIWHSWRRSKINDSRSTPVEAEMADKVQVWPYLVRVEFLTSIVVLIILTVWAITINAPLEEPANPALTPNPSKAPWYFLGLQELLVYFDPWIAGVMLPTLIIMGLIAIPYIDINPKGNGYYTIKERPFAQATFAFGFLVLWVVLIVMGTFFRGPGWNIFTPWEAWDPHRVVPLNNVDLPALVGVPTLNVDNTYNPLSIMIGAALILIFYSIGYFVWKKKQGTPFFKALGPIRYGVTAFLTLSMTGVVIKILLRLLLNVKYVLATPFFNI
ncbi:MAG: Cytochrome [Chlorobi bacterium]|nr:Cytochrome [Chlorobiota bacterium]